MRANVSNKKAGKFVNKTEEVYRYIVANPGLNEKEIAAGLSHLGGPVIHASLKTLHDHEHVARSETSEQNLRGRKLFQYQPIASRPYQPSFGPRRGTAKKNGSKENGMEQATKPRVKTATMSDSLVDDTTSDPPDPKEGREGNESPVGGGVLTLRTRYGAIEVPIEGAREVYEELKKLFGGS